MARSVFKSPRAVVVVAGQQLHQTTDFHRSPMNGATNETNYSSDYYFYKQVARSLYILRVNNMREHKVELCV